MIEGTDGINARWPASVAARSRQMTAATGPCQSSVSWALCWVRVRLCATSSKPSASPRTACCTASCALIICRRASPVPLLRSASRQLPPPGFTASPHRGLCIKPRCGCCTLPHCTTRPWARALATMGLWCDTLPVVRAQAPAGPLRQHPLAMRSRCHHAAWATMPSRRKCLPGLTSVFRG